MCLPAWWYSILYHACDGVGYNVQNVITKSTSILRVDTWGEPYIILLGAREVFCTAGQAGPWHTVSRFCYCVSLT